jgi:hypothetical protein
MTKLTVFKTITLAIANKKGQILRRKDIVLLAQKRGNFVNGSYFPSNYCDNYKSTAEPKSGTIHLFHRLKRGWYKVL